MLDWLRLQYSVLAKKSNTVTDALSRISETMASELLILSVPHFAFLNELKQELPSNLAFLDLQKPIPTQPSAHPNYDIQQGLILQQGRIWLPKDIRFIPTLITEFHASPLGGHMGVTKTLARMKDNFIWSGMHDNIKCFVVACRDCQHTKYETHRKAGLLYPLPVPLRPWEGLSLDFIVGLPPYRGHTTILVIVDRFSKGIHLAMLPTHYIAH